MAGSFPGKSQSVSSALATMDGEELLALGCQKSGPRTEDFSDFNGQHLQIHCDCWNGKMSVAAAPTTNWQSQTMQQSMTGADIAAPRGPAALPPHTSLPPLSPALNFHW